MVELEAGPNGVVKKDETGEINSHDVDRLVNLGDKTTLPLSEAYNLYFPDIFGYCYRRTGDREVAADLAGQTFINVVNSLDKNNHHSSFRGLIYKTAKHVVIDNYRRTNISDRASQKYLLKQKVDRELTLDSAESINIKLDISRALDYISKYQKQAIQLRYLEDLDYSEVARIMNKKRGAVVILVYRGIKNLQNIYNWEQKGERFIFGKNDDGLYIDQTGQTYITSTQLSKRYGIHYTTAWEYLKNLDCVKKSLNVNRSNFYPADQAIKIIEEHL